MFSNVTTKLLALLLAVVAWSVVSAPRRERMFERAFSVPVAMVGMARDLIVTTPLPDSVSVRLRGRSSVLRSLSSQNLEATLDLTGLQPGDVTVSIRSQALNLPPAVDVVSIDPGRIRFRMEQLRQKVVPIRAFLVGTTPGGYVPGDPAINPPQALISGPASQIRSVGEVATERVIMTGRTATFMQNVGVVSDTPLVRVIDPLSAQVTVPVTAETPAAGSADEETPDPATNASATDTTATTTRNSARAHKRKS
jgi:YbbR domain-containing protein